MEVKDAEKKNPPAPAAGAPGASEGDTPAKGDQEAAFKRITAERDTAKKERAEVSKKLQEAEDRLQRLEAANRPAAKKTDFWADPEKAVEGLESKYESLTQRLDREEAEKS